MKNLRIRPMARNDLNAVVKLDWMSFSLPWPLSAFMRELDNRIARCWVAEAVMDEPLTYRSEVQLVIPDFEVPAGQPAIVGEVVSWMIVDELHVATISTHPKVRRQGVGRTLLAHALRDGAAQGMISSLLEVRAGNQAAQRMYEAFGYKIVGVRPGYYKDNNEDALLMTLDKIDVNTLPAFVEPQ